MPLPEVPAAAHRDDDGADTIPGAPAPLRIDDDERFRALSALCASSRAFLAERDWDNLAHVERFAQAAALTKPLLAAYPAAADRRVLAHLLFPLLPAASRARAFVVLPPEVARRGPDFRIYPGDVPRIAPVYGDFLARADVVEQVVRPGAGPFLVPRSVCPGAARGAATLLVVDALDATPASVPPVTAPPQRAGPAPVRVLGRVPRALVDGGPLDGGDGDLAVRIGPDGKPLLAVDGRPEPVSAALDVVVAWMFSAGPDARGLDLRGDDDRALLLTFAHALRKKDVRGRSAFAWLEDGGAPLDVRIDVVSACVDAAFEVIARHALDPLSCRIVLAGDGGDGEWQRRAAAFLDDTALFHDVLPREARPGAPGERHVVWADALLPPGFAAGRLSHVAAGRAFARLATSLLAPLGVLPQSGLRDGSGAVVLQRLVPDDGAGVKLLPARLVSFDADGRGPSNRALTDAWRDGAGLALPEPRGAPRHDVAAMPAWLSFFLEGLA